MRFFTTVAILVMAAQAIGQRSWPQWGGPNRNFKIDAAGIADSWPVDGPPIVWQRPLGDGYSSIISDGGRLYVMYRPHEGGEPGARFTGKGTQPEIVVALDSGTGQTIWMRRNDAPFESGMRMEFGPGPNATPLLVGGRLFTAGTMGLLQAFEPTSGKLLWSHDLYREYGGKVMGRGYSSSPISVGDTVVVTVGGAGQALVAFDQATGEEVWKDYSFDKSFASPLLIDVEGQEQLVVFHSSGIAGVDPRGGESYWNHEHKTKYGLNISLPAWADGNLLFMSSAYDGGSRVIRLGREGSVTQPEELWFSNRLRIHFGTAVAHEGRVYGSSGDFGPAFLAAVDLESGEELWRERGFARSSFVWVDGKLVLLDEDGVLALAEPTDTGLEVKGRVQLLTHRSWTPPTVAGNRVYARDRRSIVAVDIGRGASSGDGK